MIKTSKVININNTNVRDNNNIGTNKEQYKNEQNNKRNSYTGETQILEEEKYRSKIIRHLRLIESRIKRSKSKRSDYKRADKDPASKIRKQLATKKIRPPEIQKTPKIYFSHVPKYRSTNIDTVDPNNYFSLFQK